MTVTDPRSPVRGARRTGVAALNIHAIPAHHPFLDSLAAGVLARLGDAPDGLARVTLLLPTRRAARALRESFLRAADGRALLLPRMRALAGLSTEDADELDLPALLDLPPAVEPLTRQAVLARMIARLPRRFGGANAPEHAWSLAGDLARLLDEVALEERDPTLLRPGAEQSFAEAWLGRFDRLAPEHHAQHWAITTTFLRAIMTDWNAWLRERELLDIGLRRVFALTAQAEAWRRSPPTHPVIAAGIGAGGTVPAAAALLHLLARLDHGAVVLQGMCDLGRDATEPPEPALWDAIGAAATHPFCGQARLLGALDAGPGDIRPWHDAIAPAAPAERAMLLARAMRPAAGIAVWTRQETARWDQARQGLSLLRAADAQQEAVACALLLRGALERPDARAALVTPDRELARRVAAEIARHGITADDSAGEPLAITPAASFLRLIASMLAEDFAPVALLSVMKHPLCAAGMDRAAWLGAVRQLELNHLRGPRPAPGLAGLRAAVTGADGPVVALLDAFGVALGDFTTLHGQPRPPADLLAAQMAAAEALASTDTLAGGLRLYAGEEGEPLARHLADLADAFGYLGPIDARDWPALFAASLAGPLAPSLRSVRGHGDTPHPRVEILGLLEARLLSFDTIVLGALEETVWPMATDPGPWMSRTMRAAFGLPEPEARIGRVAADFLHATCAAPEAILSAATRRDRAPSVPARWLTRLEVFLGGQGKLALDPSPALSWAAALDAPETVAPGARPAPAPPAALRPRRLAVSDAATLIADPYAFYARRMLRLAPLDELDADVGAQDYGVLVHNAMQLFLAALGKTWPGEAAARAAWASACDEALVEYTARPGVVAFWGPRLANMGAFVVAEEQKLREPGGLVACHAEISGKLVLHRPGGRIEIAARADRLDHLAAGGWRVVDYKTGTVPTEGALADGRAPQLPVEALLVAEGGFPGVPEGSAVTALVYWKLMGGDVAGEEKAMPLAAKDGTPFAALARERLEGLADRYLFGAAPFASHPHPGRTAAGGDYDHLARVAEWSAGEEEAP